AAVLCDSSFCLFFVFFFQAEDGIRDRNVTGVQTCALPISLIVNEPYVLVCPTYGGGVSLSGENSRPVPRQVIRFLNNEHNRSFIRAVVAGGNSNFGPDFGKAGEVISGKCKVPYVYRFEMMGNEDDVRICRGGLLQNAAKLGLEKQAS